LGLIAFELLTGKKFIVGNTQKLLIRKIITVILMLFIAKKVTDRSNDPKILLVEPATSDPFSPGASAFKANENLINK
jgi:hypothetical protein